MTQVTPTPDNGIHLTLTTDTELGGEGYQLTISAIQLQLTANSPQGLFRGVQTICQLLPVKAVSRNLQHAISIPGGTIRDYPEYNYRGFMLDVSRHFFGLEDVKHCIDLLALFKMNVLHLHLSDDQGWRIEIKSWPKLTTVGGSTDIDGGKGGFYTQEQYAELVEYAQSRYITIIPEIDMPGHATAALAAYPELGCNGKAPKLYPNKSSGELCTKKEITYEFINQVVGELAQLTPGPYIHIGGDESHTKKNDYIPFIERVQDIVRSHHKIMIGWDDIASAKLDSNSIVQYWHSAENAQKATLQKAKLIMSPAPTAYLDMKYTPSTRLGYKWAGYIDVDTGYNWDPASLADGITRQHILGIEAPLWKETVTNRAELEYRLQPRLAGNAEIGWSPASIRNWEDYKERLAQYSKRFDEMEINYYKSKLIPWMAD